MKSVFTKAWALDAAERAIKTAVQVLVVLLGQDKLFDVFEVNWGEVLGTAAGAALLSILTSVISANVPAADMSPASLVADDPKPHNPEV